MTVNGRSFGVLPLALAILMAGSWPYPAAAQSRQGGAAQGGQAPSAVSTPPSTPVAGSDTARGPSVPGSAQPAAPADPAAQAASEAAVEQADRVQKALDSGSTVDFNGNQLRFYLQIVARPPMTFAEYAKGSDLMYAPTRRGNPMSHQEFLQLVTPKEFHSSGGITPMELLQFALTNWVGQTLVRRGLDEIRTARTEQEKQAIRERIDRELAILRTKGGSSR